MYIHIMIEAWHAPDAQLLSIRRIATTSTTLATANLNSLYFLKNKGVSDNLYI